MCVCVPFHHNRITGQSFLSSLTFSKFYHLLSSIMKIDHRKRIMDEEKSRSSDTGKEYLYFLLTKRGKYSKNDEIQMLSPVGCIVQVGGSGKVLRTFLFILPRNSFFGDDSKAINFGTEQRFRSWQPRGSWAGQTAVFQCAKMRFIATDNLSVFRLFFSLPTARKSGSRDSFVDWKNLFRRRRGVRSTLYHFQAETKGWMDR